MKTARTLNPANTTIIFLCVFALGVWAAAVAPHYECVDHENAVNCDSNCNCPVGHPEIPAKCCFIYNYSGTCRTCVYSIEMGLPECTQNPSAPTVPCSVQTADCIDDSDGEWYSDVGCKCDNPNPPFQSAKRCDCN